METRPPETAGSADGAGAIGGLAPALVASRVGTPTDRTELEVEPLDLGWRR